MDIVQSWPLHRVISIQLLMQYLRYFFIAGGAYMIFYQLFKKYFSMKVHSPNPVSEEQLRREIKYSLLSLTIFILPSIVVVSTLGESYNKLYFSIADHGTGYYALQFVIFFFWHDAYFYFAHRIMHTKLLYKRFHSIHHKSIYPTPWAAFAFNPGEAFVHSMAFVLLPFIFPIHASVFAVFTLFSLLHNVYGHVGMDILKKECQDKFPLKYFNHPTHHGAHHRFNKGNYGLYLKMWDKIMGTWIGDMNGDKD